MTIVYVLIAAVVVIGFLIIKAKIGKGLTKLEDKQEEKRMNWYKTPEAKALFDKARENLELTIEFFTDYRLEGVRTLKNGGAIYNEYYKPLEKANIYYFADTFLKSFGIAGVTRCTGLHTVAFAHVGRDSYERSKIILRKQEEDLADTENNENVYMVKDVAECPFLIDDNIDYESFITYGSSNGEPNMLIKWLLFANENKLIGRYGTLRLAVQIFIIRMLTRLFGYETDEDLSFLFDVELYTKVRRNGDLEIIDDIVAHVKDEHLTFL